MSEPPRGVDIEIIERNASGLEVTVPNTVIIEGQEIYISDDGVQVSNLSHNEVTAVTLTMFVRTLTVRPEGKKKTRAFGGEVVHVQPEDAA
jgi:hypothetical protein